MTILQNLDTDMATFDSTMRAASFEGIQNVLRTAYKLMKAGVGKIVEEALTNAVVYHGAMTLCGNRELWMFPDSLLPPEKKASTDPEVIKTFFESIFSDPF